MATKPTIKKQYGRGASKRPLQEIESNTTRLTKRSRLDPFHQPSIKPPRTSTKLKPAPKSTQLYLELGQRNFGSITCKDCGMSYSRGSGNDDALHATFHKAHIGGVDYTSAYPPLASFSDGHIVHLSNTAKAKTLFAVINRDLQAVEIPEDHLANCKVFAYIIARKIVGCIIAEPKTQAFALLDNDQTTQTPSPVQCGVSRIWVSSSHRRKSIASKLLDITCCRFLYGCRLEKSKVAFSQPTALGKHLANKWLDENTLLVYA